MRAINDFTPSERQKIYHAVAELDILEIFASEFTFADFVASVWNVHDMPSEDNRYKTKYEDIFQHYVNNRDYTYDELFLSKLRVQDGDNLEKFLQNVVQYDYYKDANLQERSVEKLNNALHIYGLAYREIGSTTDGFPTYELIIAEDGYLAINLPKNTIPILVDKHSSTPTNKIGNHKQPDTFPALVLAFDCGWNDNCARTQFDVFYHYNTDNSEYIGKTKVLISSTYFPEGWRWSDGLSITDYMPDEFFELPLDFCSLGQDSNFYRNLKRAINDDTRLKSLLWGLKDAAAFTVLQDKNEDEVLWSSLIRENNAERALRTGKPILDGRSLKDRQKFKFLFKPRYAEESVTNVPIAISFDFDDEGYFERRIFALIGKNGSGKTQLLASIPESLKNRSRSDFEGEMPSFSKIIAVSNSFYDRFEIPQQTADFNYIYCGLSKPNPSNRSERVPLSLDEISRNIVDNISQIRKRGLQKDLLNTLGCIFDQDILLKLFPKDNEEKANISNYELKSYLSILSSGELSLFYLFSTIIRHIRLESILLFDEPENHLHPNAISREISAIYGLLKAFDSYAIIATHSPLIISEIRADNVFVIDREDNDCVIRKIGMESLGANLSVLTEYVFNNNSVPSHYQSIIKDMKFEGCSSSEIIEAAKSHGLPLNFPLLTYIASMFPNSTIDEAD